MPTLITENTCLLRQRLSDWTIEVVADLCGVMRHFKGPVFNPSTEEFSPEFVAATATLPTPKDDSDYEFHIEGGSLWIATEVIGPLFPDKLRGKRISEHAEVYFGYQVNGVFHFEEPNIEHTIRRAIRFSVLRFSHEKALELYQQADALLEEIDLPRDAVFAPQSQTIP